MSLNACLGLFVRKKEIPIEDIPTSSDLDTWLVWKSPSGHYCIQGLTYKKKPKGSLVELEEKAFCSLLVSAEKAAKDKIFWAQDPDLIRKWYTMREEAISFLTQTVMHTSETISFSEKEEDILGFEEDIQQKTESSTNKANDTLIAELAEKEAQATKSADPREQFKKEIEDKVLSFVKDLLDTTKAKSTCDLIRDMILAPEEDLVAEPVFFAGLGIALRREKQYELALLCYEKALEYTPTEEGLLFNIARVQYELGLKEAAKLSAQKVLKTNPQCRQGQLFLNFLNSSS